MDVTKIGCLRSMCGLPCGTRNEEVRRRVQEESQLSSRMDLCVPRWFGHMERLDKEFMAKKVMNSDVKGVGVGVSQRRLDGEC